MKVGVVVIGRNEGARLARCLDSLRGVPAVYVDSGSTDGSAELARAKGLEVIELDPALPFSAARARNAGYARLREARPRIEYVQFVDGDCELSAGWLAAAARALRHRGDVALVAGRLSERVPEQSIYNRLAEIEWNVRGVGRVDAVGGIFMARCTAFDAVGGFDPTVRAGEEPELCQRLARAGWAIQRLAAPMAVHDLGMTRLAQWWRRTARFGYAAMDVGSRFGLPHYRRANLRAAAWSAWLAAMLGALAAALLGWTLAPALALVLALGWLAQWGRIALRARRSGQPPALAAAYAFFLMLSFWAQASGQLAYVADRLRGRGLRLIEHKV